MVWSSGNWMSACQLHLNEVESVVVIVLVSIVERFQTESYCVAQNPEALVENPKNLMSVLIRFKGGRQDIVVLNPRCHLSVCTAAGR